MQSTLSTPFAFPQGTRDDRRAERSSSWSLRARRGAAVALLALLAACGGGGGSGSEPPPGTPVSVGFSVSGLTALGLVVRNGTETMSITENGRFLFPTRLAPGTAVNVEVASQPAFQQCTVANGQFTLGAQSVTNVAITCVGVRGRFAYTVTNLAERVNAYRVNETTGSLTRNTPFRYVAGTQPSGIAGDLQGRMLFVTNFGANTVSAWRIDTATGALTEVAGSPFAAPTQPKALAVHPGGRFLYVVGEGSNSVRAYAIDAQSGALAPIGTPVATGSTPQQALITPDGRLLLVANRNDQSVSVFRIDADAGTLTAAAGSPFFTGAVNAIALHPNGKLLLTIDTNISPTDNVTTFALDGTTGALTRPVITTLASANGAAFHPNGRDVYLTTTGADSRIHHYTVDEATGVLTVTADAPPVISPGAAGVVVDPTARTLHVLAGNVYGYAINPTTRALTPISPANATSGGDFDAQGLVFVR